MPLLKVSTEYPFRDGAVDFYDVSPKTGQEITIPDNACLWDGSSFLDLARKIYLGKRARVLRIEHLENSENLGVIVEIL